MSAPIPSCEPDEVHQGDTLSWTKSLADYLPADGWTLKYALSNADGRITIEASDNGDGTHLVSVAASTTDDYTAGIYTGQGYVENDAGERYTVWKGKIKIAAGLHLDAAASGYDARSHACKVVDALEAAIEGRATSTQLATSIAGRSISLMGFDELERWLNYYKRIVSSEDAARRREQGRSSRQVVKVRFQKGS